MNKYWAVIDAPHKKIVVFILLFSPHIFLRNNKNISPVMAGNIIKVTDVFNYFKPKKRKEIKPTGFIVGLKNIYLSTNIGKLLVIDIKSGKTISTLKIDKDKISRPFVSNQNLYLAKDNAIIKLN